MPPEEQAASDSPVVGRGARAREFVEVVRRRAWILAACLVLLPAAAYLFVALQPHKRSARVIVQPEPFLPSSAIVSNAVPSGWFAAPNASFVALVASTPQARLAAARLVNKSPVTFGQISATSDQKTGWATIRVTAPTGRAAIDGANAMATAVGTNLQARTRTALGFLRESVQNQLKAAHGRNQRQELQAQLDALARVVPSQQQTLQVIDPAVDSRTVSNRPVVAGVLALIVALFLGIRLVKLAERADRRVHDPEEVELLAGAPVLAALPRGHASGPEPFLRLRDTILHLAGQRSRATVVVASPMRSDGRTSVALGLATAFAASGRSVVLVDADMRNPGVAARAEVPAGPGLADVLSGGPVDESLQTMGGASSGLAILPAGEQKPDSPDMLASARMSSLLDELSERFEVVILDTPPLLAFSDAVPLSRAASAVVLVARIDHTPVRALRRTAQLLEDAGANVLGPVATEVAPTAPARRPATSRRMGTGARLTPPAVGAGGRGARP